MMDLQREAQVFPEIKLCVCAHVRKEERQKSSLLIPLSWHSECPSFFTVIMYILVEKWSVRVCQQSAILSCKIAHLQFNIE